jgi:hypothetical protein
MGASLHKEHNKNILTPESLAGISWPPGLHVLYGLVAPMPDTENALTDNCVNCATACGLVSNQSQQLAECQLGATPTTTHIG